MNRFFFLVGFLLALSTPANAMTVVEALCDLHGQTAQDLYYAYHHHLAKELFYMAYQGDKANEVIYDWVLENVYRDKFHSSKLAYEAARTYCLAVEAAR